MRYYNIYLEHDSCNLRTSIKLNRYCVLVKKMCELAANGKDREWGRGGLATCLCNANKHGPPQLFLHCCAYGSKFDHSHWIAMSPLTLCELMFTLWYKTRSVQLNTAWRMETRYRLYKMKSSYLTLYTFTLSPRFTLYNSFTLLHFSLFDAFLHSPLYTFRGMKKVETIRAFEYSCRRPSVGLSDDLGR